MFPRKHGKTQHYAIVIDGMKMRDKRPYDNQFNHYCEKCSEWKLHTRGRKYYTCLACNTKSLITMARGLTPRALDAAETCDCGEPFPESGYCKFCGTHQRQRQ